MVVPEFGTTISAYFRQNFYNIILTIYVYNPIHILEVNYEMAMEAGSFCGH